MKAITPKQREARRLRWQRRFLALEAFDASSPREVRAAIRERLDGVQERIDAAQRQAHDYAERIEAEANAASEGEAAEWDGEVVPVGLREAV